MTAANPDRVVLITGAASGIGAATARRIARRGLALAIHTRAESTESRVRLDETAAELRDQGAMVRTLTGDLAEP
ncbi:MAG TPA: SDR family NAD(P)-dependent oxidoreductase, partial [Hyphomicrobiaceae bacterium]|nr:SDR family NAD(P)-dependent oxidoreductase [Hyphomicrobiaceae bacterium]